MAEAGYKGLISYKLAQIAFDLGWDFVPSYYNRLEDSRQRDQIKQALRSYKQNIVEGSSERSLSSKLKLYSVAKVKEVFGGLEGKEELETILNYLIDLIKRGGYLLDKQINAIEEKHRVEGGYNENLLKKRLAYKNTNRKY